MVSFPESESMTIKRIEVALRNNDMQLLKEAAYKLHEKYHTGYHFTMLEELAYISDYVKEGEIPVEIKEMLCYTIEEILSVAEKNVSEYVNDEEYEKQKEVMAQNYAYNFGDTTVDSMTREDKNEENEILENEIVNQNLSEEIIENNIEETNLLNEEKPSEVIQNSLWQSANVDEVESEVEILDILKEDKVVEEPEVIDMYAKNEEDNVSSEQQEQTLKQEEVTFSEDEVIDMYAKSEEVEEQQIPKEPIEHEEGYGVPDFVDVYEENTKDENEGYGVKFENPDEEVKRGNVAIFYDTNINFETAKSIKTYRNKLNFIASDFEGNYANNILDEASSIMDDIDVEERNICKFLAKISKIKCYKIFITTSQNQGLPSTLLKEDVKFQIPMVQNTYADDATMDFIPMFGLTNLFSCMKCNTKFLNTGLDFKAITLECPECGNIAYPDIYDTTNLECNPIFWHRAFGSLMEAKTWILINPPTSQEKEAIMDFLKVAFKQSAPEKIYLYSNNNIYENLFYSLNPKTQVFSLYDTLDQMYLDFTTKEGFKETL